MLKHLVAGAFAIFTASSAFAEAKTEFWPAHVQVCHADLENSGQGAAYEMWINYSETDEGKGSCSVVSYYGFEYGCDTGFRSMCSATRLAPTGMSCSVTRNGSAVTVRVEKGRGAAKVVHVERCALTQGGDHR